MPGLSGDIDAAGIRNRGQQHRLPRNRAAFGSLKAQGNFWPFHVRFHSFSRARQHQSPHRAKGRRAIIAPDVGADAAVLSAISDVFRHPKCGAEAALGYWKAAAKNGGTGLLISIALQVALFTRIKGLQPHLARISSGRRTRGVEHLAGDGYFAEGTKRIGHIDLHLKARHGQARRRVAEERVALNIAKGGGASGAISRQQQLLGLDESQPNRYVLPSGVVHLPVELIG